MAVALYELSRNGHHEDTTPLANLKTAVSNLVVEEEEIETQKERYIEAREHLFTEGLRQLRTRGIKESAIPMAEGLLRQEFHALPKNEQRGLASDYESKLRTNRELRQTEKVDIGVAVVWLEENIRPIPVIIERGHLIEEASGIYTHDIARDNLLAQHGFSLCIQSNQSDEVGMVVVRQHNVLNSYGLDASLQEIADAQTVLGFMASRLQTQPTSQPLDLV